MEQQFQNVKCYSMAVVSSRKDLFTVLENGEKAFTVTSKRILYAFFFASVAEDLFALNLSNCSGYIVSGMKESSLKLSKVIAISVMPLAFSLYGLRNIFDIHVSMREKRVTLISRSRPNHHLK